MKKLISRMAVRLLSAQLSSLRGRALGNVVYRRGIEMLVERSGAYAFDATRKSGQRLPEFYRPAEAFETRFEHVRKTVHEVKARNILDIGCAEGYMIRRAAKELGTFAVGLEMNRRRIRVSNAESELNDGRNYGIIPCGVDLELLECIPRFDVVICFSVLHHVVRQHGREAAVKFLTSIRRVTRHRFLFDMGNPEETASDPEWGSVLAFLKGDVVGNNRALLESAGFVDVKHVADTPGYVQTAVRPLFVCSSPGKE